MDSDNAQSELTATGGCRCGGVRYEIVGPLRDVWYCHCEDCRRITGHHMAATSAPAEKVALVEETGLRWYSAQPLVSYGFCGTCGSTLFWKAENKPEHISICAGTIDQPTGVTTAGVLFDDERADYIITRPDVETYPGDRGDLPTD